jgi:tetratricopeptide (TPR) repeat protein
MASTLSRAATRDVAGGGMQPLGRRRTLVSSAAVSRSRAHRRATAAALVLLAVLRPARASAQAAPSAPARTASDANARERALDLADAGEKAYREGRLAEAADLLRQAYEAFPSAVLLYNMARIEESAGRDLRAADLYQRYLREEPAAEARGSIEKRIATLRARDAERRQARAERDQALARARSAEARADATPRAVPIGVPWAMFAVGAAATGVGIGLGAAAIGEESAAADAPTQAGALEDYDRAQGLATAANITLIGGGALTAAGVVWLLVRATSDTHGADRPAVAVRLTPRGIAFSGAF